MNEQYWSPADDSAPEMQALRAANPAPEATVDEVTVRRLRFRVMSAMSSGGTSTNLAAGGRLSGITRWVSSPQRALAGIAACSLLIVGTVTLVHSRTAPTQRDEVAAIAPNVHRSVRPSATPQQEEKSVEDLQAQADDLAALSFVAPVAPESKRLSGEANYVLSNCAFIPGYEETACGATQQYFNLANRISLDNYEDEINQNLSATVSAPTLAAETPGRVHLTLTLTNVSKSVVSFITPLVTVVDLFELGSEDPVGPASCVPVASEPLTWFDAEDQSRVEPTHLAIGESVSARVAADCTNSEGTTDFNLYDVRVLVDLGGRGLGLFFAP